MTDAEYENWRDEIARREAQAKADFESGKSKLWIVDLCGIPSEALRPRPELDPDLELVKLLHQVQDLEEAAKHAETSLAPMLEQKKKPADAARQRERAKALREEAKAVRKLIAQKRGVQVEQPIEAIEE